ncbi:MAG: hypothetical protein ACD_10C00649G0002 [uncultured bacterium]|nr:MAG: hypothetical protein ACD_10C00649G0002 [uncultured bacterium]
MSSNTTNKPPLVFMPASFATDAPMLGGTLLRMSKMTAKFAQDCAKNEIIDMRKKISIEADVCSGAICNTMFSPTAAMTTMPPMVSTLPAAPAICVKPDCATDPTAALI